MKVAVLTISDSAYQNKREDASGELIKNIIKSNFDCKDLFYKILPDEEKLIEGELLRLAQEGYDLVITTGGTGIGKRDTTPEATKKVIQKEIPGIGEAIRILTFKYTKTSILSRATAGVRDNTLIVNLPGSKKAVLESLPIILEALEHAIKEIWQLPDRHKHQDKKSFSKLVDSIEESKTLSIDKKTKQLQKAGFDIINFSVGEPDFDTPLYIKKLAQEAIEAGKTKYTPSDGIPELKEAITKYYKEKYNLEFETSEVIVTVGAKQAISFALFSLLNPYDEVLILKPYWTSYPQMVKLAGGIPKFVEYTDGFSVDIKNLISNLTAQTKAIIVNTPNNPTGCIYKQEILEELSQIAYDKNLYLIFDEIYSTFVYRGEHKNILQISPKLKNLVILVDGVSKSFGMTGWRIGWAVADREIIQRMNKVQSQICSCPSSISQYAALAALNWQEKEEFFKKINQEFKKRRDLMVNELNKIKGFSADYPDGAFYVFCNTKGVLNNQIKDTQQLSEYLLKEAKVAVVCGEAFGVEGYLRFSFATTQEKIKEGIKRIKNILN